MPSRYLNQNNDESLSEYENIMKNFTCCNEKFFVDLDPRIHNTFSDLLCTYLMWVFTRRANKVKMDDGDDNETILKSYSVDCGFPHNISVMTVDNYFIIDFSMDRCV